MTTITLNFDSNTDEAKRGITDLDKAIGKLAAQEKNNKLFEDAKKKLAGMTDGEKNAAIAALELSKNTEKASVSISKTGDTAKNAGLSLTDLKSGLDLAKGAVDKVIQGFEKVYAVAKEGASLDYAERKFANLAKAAGSTSNVLLRDLHQAVKGTRSDADLMAQAGDLMGLGLAKTSDEIIRMSRAAGALGMDMNQLVLTLTNQTTARFDQLGVSVDGFKEKVKELEAQGMTTNDAFKEAFLQQAEAQILKVGDAADTDLGKLQRFEATLENLGDAVKKKVAPPLVDVVEALTDLLNIAELVNDEALTLSKTYPEYTAHVAEQTKEQIRNNGAIQALIALYPQLSGLIYGNTVKTATLTETDYKLRMGLYDITEAIDYRAQADKRWAEYQQTVVDQTMGDLYLGLLAEEGAWTDTSGAMEIYKKSLEGVNTLAGNTDIIMQNYTKSLLFNQAAAGLDKDASLLLAASMGLIDEKTWNAMGKLDDLKQKLLDGKITLQEYTILVAGLGQAMDGIKSKEVVLTVRTQYSGTQYVDPGTGSTFGGGQAFYSQRNAEQQSGSTNTNPTPANYGNRNAFGGTYDIPQKYGYEGFNLGGIGTASGGEKVTISNGGMESLLRDIKTSLDRLPNQLRDVFQQVAG